MVLGTAEPGGNTAGAAGGGERPTALRAFRPAMHSGFGRRANALFEPCDAILTAGSVAPSPVETSPLSVGRIAGDLTGHE